VSERHARATGLVTRLGLDPAALEAGDVGAERVASLLAGADGGALVDALGDLPSPAVATLLADLEARADAKPHRKAIRRALYRLTQQGVARPAPAAEPPPPRAATEDVEGLVSHVDARGDRIVWLFRALQSGGTFLVAAQLHEPDGLRDLQVLEAARKQIRATRQRLEHEAHMRLVPADWRALDALVVEAQERSGSGPGRDYLKIRPRLTTEPPQAPAELASPRAPRPDAAEAVALVAESARLLEQPEFRGWGPDPAAAAPFVEQLTELRRSPLVLSPLQQQDRQREVLTHAAAALYPPAVVARRLAGTAYVLAETGRAELARVALAVGALYAERPASAVEIPFFAALLELGVGGLVKETETSRADSLVLTPAELRARSSSRPGRTRG
jgi:hypothetical protein